MNGLPRDIPHCEAFISSHAGSYSSEPAGRAACIAEQRALAANGTFCTDGLFNSELCDRAASPTMGTLPPGEKCTQDYECAPGAEGKAACHPQETNPHEFEYRCQIQVRGALGDQPCVGNVLGPNYTVLYPAPSTKFPTKGYLCHLADGLHCSSGFGICARLQEIGGRCGTQGDCAEGGYCDTEALKCVPTKPLGETCEDIGSWNQCEAGTYCHGFNHVCVPQRPYGADCTSHQACFSGLCSQDLKCDRSLLATYGLIPICGEPR